MGLKTFSQGGVHPPDNKFYSDQLAIEELAAPDRMIVPVQQHIGAPAKPVVAVGEEVKVGQVIAEAQGFVSVNIHSPVSGKVIKIADYPHPMGRPLLAIEIENDGRDEWFENLVRFPEYTSAAVKDLVDHIKASGIVGMGGATFPTHVKLLPPPGTKTEYYILNGVECEPYLTADHRLMLENSADVITGLRILMHITGAPKGVIGIENNKKDAIAALTEAAAGQNDIEVVALEVKYPQGAEKQLIEALYKKEVPSAGLPIVTGCIVNNVGTAVAVKEAVIDGKPLIDRVVTVTGAGIEKPRNLMVRVGTSCTELVEYCGGIKENTGKFVLGGPMMGFAQGDLDLPVIKGTSGLLFLTEEQTPSFEEVPCIRCARCVDACPMGLLPSAIGNYASRHRIDDCEGYDILDCIECGSCHYVCPAQRRLLQYIRYAKGTIIARRKQAQAVKK